MSAAQFLSDPSPLIPIDSPDALAWATSWSEHTAGGVDKQLDAELLEILNNDDRIAYVARVGEHLYNFWQDGAHPRGLWRRTTLNSYRDSTPDWEILLDIDALAQAEGENWVWQGAVIRKENDRALIKLSRGGADAATIREFDLDKKQLLEQGFFIPEARSQVSWIDHDTLIVCTDFGPGTLTISGYPKSARILRRNQQLADADELFSGKNDDLLVSAWAETEPGFERIVVRRILDFYTSRTFIHTDSGLQILELPEDCEIALRQNWLFVMPRTDYRSIPAGGLGVIALDAFLCGERNFQLLFRPTSAHSLQNISFSKTHLYTITLHHVASRITAYELGSFIAQPLELPELATARIVSATNYSEEVWLGASSFTQPDTLYRFDGHALEAIATAPALFDSTGIQTRQHFATSADGTEVPYFITGDFSRTEPQPTLVYAYGGFEVSLLPSYSAVRGHAWLSRGYFYVQANLRGGGEYGPQWHQQATKTNRMRVFEDHQAVLDDLVARGYSTPARTFVRGGSNGGLLSATAVTMYPEKIGGAIVQVPLTDMLRYHTWSAGASWMAEYGDPDVSHERAVLEQYSPLARVVDHAVRPYPPALVTTSTRDDRVHPAHARLFANALLGAGQPVAYYENSEGGHAGAANNSQTAFMEALIYSWIATQLS
ncbi:MAG: prolyl oligopeptidase family serine peptidase [Corynebacterium sp.]|uniref:prolyl oligopeptidase family serine peptidase n=1 Tax=Corynebacterium sp. TaxID=1720 RepID=UPI0026DC1A5C|nr:prolyl oligopeptidase family serine peptidase [Corynebacterium sp.]MDO4762186.1 prolyl oligopeptidase family serine peptidase [Corynebacterium sp.]